MKIVRRWQQTRTRRAQSDRSGASVASTAQPEASPDRVVAVVQAVTEMAKSWGATLRLVTILLVAGTVVLVLAQAVPWDVLAGR